MKLINVLLRKPPKIGLALSGGATHGAAHIGVLRVLEKEGIKLDFITGTSAGAIVGSAYCSGMKVDELSDLWRTMRWPTLLRPSLLHSMALFDTSPMEVFIRSKFGDCEFKDLDIPFAAIACDIVTSERVVLNSGPLAPAVRASAAVPGLFSPVEIDNHLLVDGGIVDNLPVTEVKKMGADYVIAVDLAVRGGAFKRPENPFEVLMEMINIMQSRSTLPDPSECDCYIRPDVSKYSKWEFGDSDAVENEGVKAAEGVMDQLRKDLRLKS